MYVLKILKQSINTIGIKEVARRAGLASSTISRIHSGEINPSLEVIEKISSAVGFRLDLIKDFSNQSVPRLIPTKRILSEIKNELKKLGVKHAIVFGSVARQEDRQNSDIDIYLDFGDVKPSISDQLTADGTVLEAFGNNKVDLVNNLALALTKAKKLKKQIEKDGIRAF